MVKHHLIHGSLGTYFWFTEGACHVSSSATSKERNRHRLVRELAAIQMILYGTALQPLPPRARSWFPRARFVGHTMGGTRARDGTTNMLQCGSHPSPWAWS